MVPSVSVLPGFTLFQRRFDVLKIMWIPFSELTYNKAEITTLLTCGLVDRRCSDTEVLGSTLVSLVWVGRTTIISKNLNSDFENNVSKLVSSLFNSPLTQVLLHLHPVSRAQKPLPWRIPVFCESQWLCLMGALDEIGQGWGRWSASQVLHVEF